jgi:hypothetical protein
MAKAKLSSAETASELSSFKFDTSSYLSLRPLAALKNRTADNVPTPSPRPPEGKKKD